jgi:RNA recognition motif-containing protein
MWWLRHRDTITPEESVMNIFVGNLAFTTTEEELALLFHPYGVINRVRIVQDGATGRSRGFGFVEMPDASEAQAALASLQGTTLGGRALTVTQAHPREEREGPRRLRR